MKEKQNRKTNSAKPAAFDAEAYLKANGLSDEALDRGKTAANGADWCMLTSGSV